LGAQKPGSPGAPAIGGQSFEIAGQTALTAVAVFIVVPGTGGACAGDKPAACAGNADYDISMMPA
jgi:hypothetical protein